MPYNESKKQAWLYFEIAKDKLSSGNFNEAKNNFNLAYNIADYNNMTDLMALIDSYRRSL